MTTQPSLWQDELTDVNRLIASKEQLLRQFPDDNFLRASLTQFRERRNWLMAQIRAARRPSEAN